MSLVEAACWPAATEERLECLALKIEAANRRGLQVVFEIGDLLRQANEELASHHGGTFQKWVRERLGMTPRGARNYMNAAAAISHSRTRETVSQHFDCKAAYLLTADSTSEEALADAIKAAKRGERVDFKRAKEFAAKYADNQPAISTWDLYECIERLHGYVQKVYQYWPPAEVSAMPDKLRSIADAIEAGRFFGGEASDC